jgi:hypothetical protein
LLRLILVQPADVLRQQAAQRKLWRERQQPVCPTAGGWLGDDVNVRTAKVDRDQSVAVAVASGLHRSTRSGLPLWSKATQS